MHKLVEYICDELEELERKADKDGKLSMAEVQYMDTLAHAKKNLLKSDAIMDGDYSFARDENDGYSRRMYYDDGASYARGRRSNVRRDAMGRYSRAGEDFRMELQELMKDAPNDHVRQKLQNIMSEM